MRFLATIAYDGSKYNGYQKQVHGNTVQDKLEEILTNINGGSKVSVSASGRTDAGVHALGQTANFHTNSSIQTNKITYALNSKLPKSIVVKSAEDISPKI